MSFQTALKRSQDKSLPAFQRAQYEFTAHIRAPEQVAAPTGIEDRRLAIYRELLFNNVKGFLDNCFPVLSSLVSEQEWSNFCRQFFAEHSAQSPFFNDINAEFVEFISKVETPIAAHVAPFAAELAHYEWMELVVQIATDALPEQSLAELNIDTVCACSPLAYPLAYRFDVQRIGKAYMPNAAPTQPSFLVIYRDRHDHTQFMSLNALSFQVLSLLTENPMSINQLAQSLQAQLSLDHSQLVASLTSLLHQWLQRDIVLA